MAWFYFGNETSSNKLTKWFMSSSKLEEEFYSRSEIKSIISDIIS